MNGIKRHLSYANVAATLALVFAMSGGAIAASGGFSSGGTLQACVNGDGSLKLLKPGKHCARGQKTVAWNQQGPAGPAGKAGAAGAGGATGAVGGTGPQGKEGKEGASESGPAEALMTGGSTDEEGVEAPGGGGFIAGSGMSELGGESNTVVASGVDTTARNLFVKLSEAPSSPPGFPNPGLRVVLYVNHSRTSLSCVINAPGTTCSDTSHGASVPAGATLSILAETLTEVTEIPLVTFGYDLVTN
jgi:hypothetical protein